MNKSTLLKSPHLTFLSFRILIFSLVGYEHPLRIYFAALRDAMETVKNPDEKSLQEVQAALDFLKIWWKRPEMSLKVLLEANPMLSVME